MNNALTYNVEGKYALDGIINVALGWTERASDSDYVVRIERIAGYDPETLDAGGLRFDDASIRVTEDGRSKTIRPDSIRALFTYPLAADVQPADDAWIDGVRLGLAGTLSDGTDITI
ncbi:hypothetical protein GCM10023221_17850 [Luteimicrobium xylanilyticum]|uniref:Uncharacterized protein n=1 Tax=Luteimicrobium xylanilyticum TaxID=1133546 RepID=A0A5P9Q8G3_9MICO|nr:hypothetical protein [Luteimicrobium xylanilyticum]QFU97721.1 hypothetical protein KDY119_01220 [Luteimicrobium xylanilyticum]